MFAGSASSSTHCAMPRNWSKRRRAGLQTARSQRVDERLLRIGERRSVQDDRDERAARHVEDDVVRVRRDAVEERPEDAAEALADVVELGGARAGPPCRRWRRAICAPRLFVASVLFRTLTSCDRSMTCWRKLSRVAKKFVRLKMFQPLMSGLAARVAREVGAHALALVVGGAAALRAAHGGRAGAVAERIAGARGAGARGGGVLEDAEADEALVAGHRRRVLAGGRVVGGHRDRGLRARARRALTVEEDVGRDDRLARRGRARSRTRGSRCASA